MWTSIVWKIALVVAFISVNVIPAMAQGRGGRGGGQGGVQIGAGNSQQNTQAMQQAIQQIDQQLQQGDQVLQEASEKANEARQVWQQADAENKKNLRDLAQAKKSAEEEAKNLPELKAAKDKLESLRGELAEVRKKVIETLTSENEDYQAACKVYDDAVAKQKANSGSSVTSESRREFAKKVAEADKNKKGIEEVALADNSEAKEMTKQIKEATAELGAASKMKTEAIESDANLNSAKTAFLRSRDELKKAKTELDQADGEARRIRSAMFALVNQRASIQNQINNQQRMQQQGGNGNQQYGNRNTQPRR